MIRSATETFGSAEPKAMKFVEIRKDEEKRVVGFQNSPPAASVALLVLDLRQCTLSAAAANDRPSACDVYLLHKRLVTKKVLKKTNESPKKLKALKLRLLCPDNSKKCTWIQSNRSLSPTKSLCCWRSVKRTTVSAAALASRGTDIRKCCCMHDKHFEGKTRKTAGS